MTGYGGTEYGGTEYGETEYGGTEYGETESAEPDKTAVAGRTGHPAVDAALQAVVAAGSAAPVDQIPAYQAAHRTLRDTLASIDEQ